MSANNAVTVLRSPWSHRLPLEFACATRGAPDAFHDQQVISSARHGLPVSAAGLSQAPHVAALVGELYQSLPVEAA
jgi:hypothetical protein